MTELSQTPRSPEKQALLRIRELKQQIAELQRQGPARDPIAVVSMACRFPRRAATPELFWQSLMTQSDEVTEIPADRWDLDAFHDDDADRPGRMYARHGVFLDRLDLMDAEFFGISPREATWVDPQQRLLMEVGWEALERAGWTPADIGPSAGIFVGWMHNDYQNEASDSFLNLNPYIATGAAGSFLCGRLAWSLGLQGPSVAVDTACSSSLVAVHLACLSLQQRECDYALVGGVNTICSPTTNILTCKLKALSPTGQSRAFDAAADGYLRGEGCGVVTLRRLSDAVRDGDTVLGVIQGTAIGHNGTGSGLTVPNPKAQESVIRQAVRRAGVDARDVAYLEAHGTGTELGDPIEMQAAAAALAGDRDFSDPLLVGSVKTNIGHLEAAAGMAGLIKVLLSLQHDCIPGQRNFETPNPHIPWDRLPVRVLTEATAWPSRTRRIAGVSAFGMSGTNAHVVVSSMEPAASAGRRSGPPRADATVAQSSAAADASPTEPQPASLPEQSAAPQLLVISAKTAEACTELAGRYEEFLGAPGDASLSDIASMAATGREHFEHRAAVVAADSDEARRAFSDIARDRRSANVIRGTARRRPKVLWQFTGQGSQYAGMAEGLYRTEPVFRAAMDHCSERLQEWRRESLIDVLFGGTDAIHHTRWTQPAIFAVQMGLVKVLNAAGLQPDVVLGHSVGQYAAACVADILSWDDGLWLISERGRLIGELPTGGMMLAVFAPVSDVAPLLAGDRFGGELSLAANNGTHVVVSGTAAAVADLNDQFTTRGVRTQVLRTSHAFHSHLMDPAVERFRKVADQVTFHRPQLPLVCNVSGQVLPQDRVLDGDYWAGHIREPVRFADSLETAQQQGCDVLLELGPAAVLTRMAAGIAAERTERLVSCLHRDADDSRSLRTALGRLYVLGATPNFRSLFSPRSGPAVLLPTYPFQRRRFWGPDKPRALHAEFHTAHPLLGGRMTLAGVADEVRYESRLEPDSPPWLPDHQVAGSVVFPGAAFIEMALIAGEGGAVEDVAFEQPLQPVARTTLQSVVRGKSGAERSLEIFSADSERSDWSRHLTAKLVPATAKTSPLDLSLCRDACPQSADRNAFYQKLDDIGLHYGPAFRTVHSLQYSDTAVLSRLAVESDLRGFLVPPPLLDGALHSLAVGLLDHDDGQLFLPVGLDRIHCPRAIPREVWCFAEWQAEDGPIRRADLRLFDDSGEVLLVIEGLRVQQVSRAALRRMGGQSAARLLWGIEWKPARLGPPDDAARRWLVVETAATAELASRLESQLAERGQHVQRVLLQPGADLQRDDDRDGALDGSRPDQWQTLLNPNDDGTAPVPLGGVVVLPSDAVSMASRERTADRAAQTQWLFDSLLNLVRALNDHAGSRIECGLQLMTQRAIATTPAEGCDPEQTKFWGFGRVAAAEYPRLRCRLIDLSVGDDEAELPATVCDILLTETRDNQFAVHGSRLLVPRLRQLPRPAPQQPAWRIRSDAGYLITGGLGKLGRQAARWLADQGAGQVVLVSRRAPDDETASFLDAVRARGCDVVVQTADLTSPADLENLFGRFSRDLRPLAGVIHAAGVLDDGLISEQSGERFAPVLGPKVTGTRLLDAFTRSLPLDFFILYSSIASVLGPRGQSNYAAANAFLDGVAWQRRAAGQRALSINWGAWTEGMANDERIQRQLALQGMTPLESPEAHAALQVLLSSDTVQATVVDVDWNRMRRGTGGDLPEMLSEVVPKRRQRDGGDSALVGQLKQLPPAGRRERLVRTIQDLLQSVLAAAESPETDRPLIEMGLDSLMAVEFSTQLQVMLGEQFAIGPTMLFDHPTIDAIADHIHDMLSSDTAAGSEPDSAPHAGVPADRTESDRGVREPVAIIGMSCRFPGARNVDEFWNNLMQGVDSVRDIPPDRWDVDRFFDPERRPGTMYTREGGFLEDIGDFDPDFFHLSAQEACWIDPQHRLLLENSYQALEDAGIPVAPLDDPNVGVFMGLMGQDYAFLPQLDDQHIIAAFQGAGLSHSAGVGRISYLFGFEGPSIAVDTASSSSLVALHQAVRSLQEGNCNLALAGGVNAILAPVNSLLMCKAGLLSPDGRCKSFSAQADGFGRGEGCGVVVLKRLSDAERDGDRVLAIVRGGAVVHNGSSGGITTPSTKAQVRVIRDALRDAQLAPSQVQYLEAHGTGTELGDSMEISAAASVYGKGRQPDQPLLVGSVKANISHLEAAGGISGVIKTVLCLQHGVIPPQLHFDEPSRHIPWKRSRVRVVADATPWPEAERRLAGVTALGLVGTNAHVILEGGPATAASLDADDAAPQAQPVSPTSELLLLSARDRSALRELAGNFRDFLSEHAAVPLANICHTAATGRQHFTCRIGFVVHSHRDAVRKLDQFLQNSANGHPPDAMPSHPRLALAITGDHQDPLTHARSLYAAEPSVRALIERLSDRFRQSDNPAESAEPNVPPLQAWLTGDAEPDSEDRVAAALLTWVLTAGLAELWRARGVDPDTVLGSGIGQLTAAAVAGCLSLEDAGWLMWQRALAEERIRRHPEQRESALDEFERLADGINFYPPGRQLVCSLTGDIFPIHRSPAGSYWRQHLETSGTATGLTALTATQCDLVLQLGSDAGFESLDDGSGGVGDALVIRSLTDTTSAPDAVAAATAALYAAGITPDLRSLNRHRALRRVPVPHYPFRRQRYWITEIDRHQPPEPAAEVSRGAAAERGQYG